MNERDMVENQLRSKSRVTTTQFVTDTRRWTISTGSVFGTLEISERCFESEGFSPCGFPMSLVFVLSILAT